MGYMYAGMLKAKVVRKKNVYPAYFKDKKMKTILDYLSENIPEQKKEVVLCVIMDHHYSNFPRTCSGLQNMGIKISGIYPQNLNYDESLKQFGIKEISQTELCLIKDKPNIALLICAVPSKETWGFLENLIANGFNRENIYLTIQYYEPQYFDAEIIKPSFHEIFIDAGALDLETSRNFIKWSNGNYDFIYAFEPEEYRYSECLDRLNRERIFNKEKIKIFRKGLSDHCGKERFSSILPGGSRIDPNGKTEIETIRLDSILNGKPVTFIKMDIEGSELKALKGSEYTIKKWKPRLAICLYHEWEDIIEIPSYILHLVPEYKMYIRHYSTIRGETVLLCTV
jgi:FkbM family methyltransferase